MTNKSLKKINLRNKKSIKKYKKGGGGPVQISGRNEFANDVNTANATVPVLGKGEFVSPFQDPLQEIAEESNGGKYKKGYKKHKGGNRNIPIDIKTNVEATQQWTNPNIAAPIPQYQGGIYTGPQAYGPWGVIPVTPTTSNMIHKNLVSSSPPPGANVQYQGTNHLGNNFSSMPGISWFHNTTDMNPGPFRIKGTPCTQKGGKRKRNSKKKINKTKNKKRKSKKGGNQNIPIDIKTNVPPTQQWTNPNVAAPAPQYQGGIYTGPQAYGPWGFIPVTPTTSNMIHNNLKSANPPPGATVQYPGTNRLGNNFSSMPGVSWYNNTTEMNPGQFRIKGTPCTSKGGKTKKNKGRKNLKKKTN
tara:strand:+ start:625 stop:1698 length:1074 start_codon:yes stop_codon:yes gene_type:complete